MIEVYLDNSATTCALEPVAKAVYDFMTGKYGNPSSLHGKGIEAEKMLRTSREMVADFLGVKPNEIYFTSGGTESNNLAIKGTIYNLRRWGNHLITTSMEHPSILETFRYLEKEGFKVTYLSPDKDGYIDVKELERALTPETILVSIMYVNNEVGTIQPIEQAASIIKKHNSNTLFHVDAVQAFGKIPLVPKLKGIDLLSVSSHKIHGPKGIGALFVRDKVKITPLLHGGGQESGVRSGTENVPGIVGFKVAVEYCHKNFEDWQNKMKALKEKFIESVLAKIPDVVLNSPKTGAPHIVNISFLGTRGEILLHSLESRGIYVSTGSACSSHKGGKSHVLDALGKNPEEKDSAIRFSLSPFISMEDIDYTVKTLQEAVYEIRKFVRR